MGKTKKDEDAGALKNRFGVVRVYTRHISSCKHASDPKHNSCSCPKWAYEHRKAGERKRYSLNTPSFAEAITLAADTLRGWDPEIAANREEKAKRQSTNKTVEEAIQLWIDRTKNRFGEDAGIVAQYRSTFGWRDDQGNARGNLLTFVEAYNRKHPKTPIQTIRDITPLIAQELQNSLAERYASDDTRKQRWGTVRSFFSFLHSLGVVTENPVANIAAGKAKQEFANVPYTDKQFTRILNEADWYVDDRVRDGEKEVYCRRSRLFLEMLRYTGMDVSDAVMFQPSMIADELVDGKVVHVLRYRRKKTNVQAVVVLSGGLAGRLRNTPAGPSAMEDRPFRYKGNLLSSDVHNWGRRIAKLISLAKIGKVQLMKRDGTMALDSSGNAKTHNPNVKMLRHTFAVGELLKGRKPEVVAKQLGHVDTDMVFRHYAPWCAARDTQHIREQLY